MSEHVRDYTTVSIPKNLAERVREILTRAGYQSFAEFVRDAARRRLEEIEKEAPVYVG